MLPVQVCVSTEEEGSDGRCSEGFGNKEVFHVGRYRSEYAQRCTATQAQLQRTITACVRTLGPFSTSYHMRHTHQTAVRNTHPHIQQDGIPERIKREKMIRTKCHFCAVTASRELSNTYPQLFEYVVWIMFWSLGTKCSCSRWKWGQGHSSVLKFLPAITKTKSIRPPVIITLTEILKCVAVRTLVEMFHWVLMMLQNINIGRCQRETDKIGFKTHWLYTYIKPWFTNLTKWRVLLVFYLTSFTKITKQSLSGLKAILCTSSLKHWRRLETKISASSSW